MLTSLSSLFYLFFPLTNRISFLFNEKQRSKPYFFMIIHSTGKNHFHTGWKRIFYLNLFFLCFSSSTKLFRLNDKRCWTFSNCFSCHQKFLRLSNDFSFLGFCQQNFLENTTSSIGLAIFLAVVDALFRQMLQCQQVFDRISIIEGHFLRSSFYHPFLL